MKNLLSGWIGKLIYLDTTLFNRILVMVLVFLVNGSASTYWKETKTEWTNRSLIIKLWWSVKFVIYDLYKRQGHLICADMKYIWKVSS